jgi:hypothetical protein
MSRAEALARLAHYKAGTGPYDGTRLEWDVSELPRAEAPVVKKKPTKTGHRPRPGVSFSLDEVAALVQLFDALGQGRAPRLTKHTARVAGKFRRMSQRYGV